MLLLIIKLIITSPGGPWAPQGPDALQSSLIASAWQKVCTVPTQGSNKSSWHARTEMHQTKESGSLRSRAPKGVCTLGQALGDRLGTLDAQPPLPPRGLIATPPAPPPHPAPDPDHAGAPAPPSGAKVEPLVVI